MKCVNTSVIGQCDYGGSYRAILSYICTAQEGLVKAPKYGTADDVNSPPPTPSSPTPSPPGPPLHPLDLRQPDPRPTMAGAPVTAKKESVTLEEVEAQQGQGKVEGEGERERWKGRRRGEGEKRGW